MLRLPPLLLQPADEDPAGLLHSRFGWGNLPAQAARGNEPFVCSKSRVVEGSSSEPLLSGRDITLQEAKGGEAEARFGTQSWQFGVLRPGCVQGRQSGPSGDPQGQLCAGVKEQPAAQSHPHP